MIICKQTKQLTIIKKTDILTFEETLIQSSFTPYLPRANLLFSSKILNFELYKYNASDMWPSIDSRYKWQRCDILNFSINSIILKRNIYPSKGSGVIFEVDTKMIG